MERVAVLTMKELNHTAKRDLGRYRYDIFVNKMGWDISSIPFVDFEEWDQFDCESTIYVIIYSSADDICGCARLIPTTKPYLLSEIFPHLVSGVPASGAFTWELSRVTTWCQENSICAKRMRLLWAGIFTASRMLNARTLIGVAPRSMQRVYRRLGIELIPMSVIPTAKNGLTAFLLNVSSAEPRFEASSNCAALVSTGKC
jgi:N-acyl-L-homoserine lactone synthetase